MEQTDFKRQLKEIIEDNKSGSSELTEKIARLLLNKTLSNLSISEDIEALISHLTEFASVQNLLMNIRSLKKEEQLLYLQEFLNKSINKIQKIYENLKPKLSSDSSIVTISNSRTIAEVLKLAVIDFSNLSIIISESRPVNEGVLMAEYLADIGADVTLITEAQLATYIERCGFTLIGADKILKNDSVINKVGSRLIAILSKYFSKPLYVIADKSKFVEQYEFTQNEHRKTEIYNGENRKIKVAPNFYFERIEQNLITEIISD